MVTRIAAVSKHSRGVIRRWWRAALWAVVAIVVTPPSVFAVCGDANRDGFVTVTDGVLAFRAAAELSTTCSLDVCDVDGNGVITVSDGVNILRAAAGLPSAQCGVMPLEQLITSAVLQPDTTGELHLGVDPAPRDPSFSTIDSIEVLSIEERPSDFAVHLRVTFDVGAAAGNPSVPSLILSASADDVAFVNFYEAPLSTTVGVTTIALSVQRGKILNFVVNVATRFEDAVSLYSGANVDLPLDVGVAPL